MSRYTKQTDQYTYAWGFDEPLSEYFFQKFNNYPDPLDEDAEDVVFSISSYSTTVPHPDYPNKITYTNSEILDIMEQEGVVPQHHLDQIVLDLTF